jgi:hypothetical protein
MADRPRVVIASPDRLECGALADWLTAEGFEPVPRSTPRAAVDEMRARAFDLLIADAVFAFRDRLHVESRARRPLTPTVILGDTAAANGSDSMSPQIMHLPRPVERAFLVCTVGMALADGRPARCSARKLVHRFDALINGFPSYIVDVSNEGLRLELPRDRRLAPTPYFTVVVPLIGVGVRVQRMWAKTRSENGRIVTWCGGALSNNHAKAARAWRVFVDTIPVIGAPSPDSLELQ